MLTMFGKGKALFKQTRAIFRVKKKHSHTVSNTYLFFFLSFLDPFHTALLQMVRPEGQCKALVLRLQEKITQVKTSVSSAALPKVVLF